MGSLNVLPARDPSRVRVFTQHLFKDIEALETMIAEGMIEEGITRIGAEQELSLIDQFYRPASIADKTLAVVNDPHFTNELSKFNLEINLDPIKLEGRSLSSMHHHLQGYLDILQAKLQQLKANYILVGILPTIRSSDLEIQNMTPQRRYEVLNEAIIEMRGGPQEFRIQGTDELITKNNSVMFESCNTSFQIHYQVGAQDFKSAYNWAQAIAAPVLAAATNSPLFLGKRLWRETRIALFRQSTDTRGRAEELREIKARVYFGDSWVEKNVLDIIKDDIASLRFLVIGDITEDAMATLKQGQLPKLQAFNLFNGTIYKWNRPCYGISEGKAHLRIENRYLPAGPTVQDEMANMAFWVGLMHGRSGKYQRISEELTFDTVKSNFVKAARMGLTAQLSWLDQKRYKAEDLILNELAPIAREGLQKAQIDSKDIDTYLGILEERVRTGRTGSQWLVDSFSSIKSAEGIDAAVVASTAGLWKRQQSDQPVHKWSPAQIKEAGGGINRFQRIDQIMSRKLYTVQEEDLIDMAPNIMMWKQVRHLMVENKKGELVGLVTLGRLGQHYSLQVRSKKNTVPVKNVMVKEVIAVTPETPTVEAAALMRAHKIGCLPVVNADQKLVGIVTERDFVKVAELLLKESERIHTVAKDKK